MKKYKFKPTKELIHFAIWFSESYKNLEPAIYKSKNDIYTIDYLKKDPSPNDVMSYERRNFSVGQSGVFILSKDKLPAYSKNFVFYIVIWMAAHRGLFGKYAETDIPAVKYYLTTKRSKKDMILGFLQSIEHQLPISKLNVDRLAEIKKMLSK